MTFVTLGWPGAGHVPADPGATASVSHYVYVENADEMFEGAIAAGASPIAAPADAYCGERCATVVDPFGHLWTLATRLETLSAEVLPERRTLALGLVADVDAVDASENLVATGAA